MKNPFRKNINIGTNPFFQSPDSGKAIHFVDSAKGAHHYTLQHINTDGTLCTKEFNSHQLSLHEHMAEQIRFSQECARKLPQVESYTTKFCKTVLKTLN